MYYLKVFANKDEIIDVLNFAIEKIGDWKPYTAIAYSDTPNECYVATTDDDVAELIKYGFQFKSLGVSEWLDTRKHNLTKESVTIIGEASLISSFRL